MSGAETAGTTQYLTYKLADEVFALDIGKVREVLDFTTVTKVPRTPEFMRGVINLIRLVPGGGPSTDPDLVQRTIASALRRSAL